jgi:adenylate cyclase
LRGIESMTLGINRSRKIFLRTACAAALASTFLIWGVSGRRTSSWLEGGTYDARVRWSADARKSDRDIVIVDVDEASFNGLKDNLGRWPWSRRVWSSFLYHLSQGKPRAIVFDSIFGGQEGVEVDGDFAGRIREAGNVVLAYSLSGAVEMTFAGDDVNAGKFKVVEVDANPQVAGAVGEQYAAMATAYNVPLQAFASSAAGLGCVTSVPDSDGVNRRIALQFLVNGRVLPSLSVRTAQLASATNGVFVRRGRSAVQAGRTVPVDDQGRLVILWHGDANSYERIPAWKLIASIYPQQFPENRVYYPPEYFRNKIVLIGASAAGSMEARATPFSEVAPGFVIHAAALDNLLHGEGVQMVPGWCNLALILAFAVAGSAAVALFSAIWIELLLVTFCAALYWVSASLALARLHIWIPVVCPLAALLLSFAFASLGRFATTGRELRRTRNTLDRYMSPPLVNYVLENLDNINLNGERRELTIFFSDVRNFTTLTEGSEPMELINLLDEYLQAMTEVIFKYDGIVDKFIGDGILAYWGAFTPGKNHAMLAAQAALEMLVRLEQLNIVWSAQGRPTLRIGIGINTGNVVFGNVGRGKKIEFTVIGDAVNLASRLEGVNKEFGTSVIISEFTLGHLRDHAQVRSLGNIKVKGKTIETAIYELKGLNQSAVEPPISSEALASRT